MTRRYWLDLFTGKTWEEFLRNGGNVTGFREKRRAYARRIHPGDYFICYVTGISRFIGVLAVLSESYFDDQTRIWEDEGFPVRFQVKVLLSLNPEAAVPVAELRSELSIFRSLKDSSKWSGFFRGAPAEFDPQDAQAIVKAIEEAVSNPVDRPYDERAYWRRAAVYRSRVGPVTVPDDASVQVKAQRDIGISEAEKASHEEMQWLLLKVGSDLGLDVYVARNDRNKEYKGAHFSSIPNLRADLPRQFDEATNRTIELIDVLWLQKDAIIAAFEVEHTTEVYSGLLRMSDLVSMQPNIKINLYIVAPDDRRDRVIAQVNRPTFARLTPPLPRICKFIPYSRLKREIEQVGYRLSFMKPQFIDSIAESCEAHQA